MSDHPEQEGRDPAAPVVVFRSAGDIEAGLLRSLLESYGIPCSLESDITHVAYPMTVDGLGEVRLLVPAPLADEAREIIEAHRRGAAEEEERGDRGASRPGGGEWPRLADPPGEDTGGEER